MILTHWAAFRHHFATRALTYNVSLIYAPGSPSTITRASGSFIDDGWENEMDCDVGFTTSNNGRWRVSSVAALELSVEGTLVDETVVSVLEGARHSVDGVEVWPFELIQSGGSFGVFGGPTTDSGSDSFPRTLTVGGGDADTDPTVDEHDWYVSQRSDDPARQYFLVERADEDWPAETNSSAIRLSLTPLAVRELGLATSTTPLSDSQLRRALNKVHVYSQARSGRRIQWADLLKFAGLSRVV